MTATIHIGTSGWHYKHWMSVFYPAGTPSGELFKFYARHFDTVEINNSFYKLPTIETFEKWNDAAPKKFKFAVKASRFITHMKKLKDPRTSTAKFFLATEHLGSKLGPILFQLPPRWHLDIQRLKHFLSALPTGHRYVFEFRDATWLTPNVYQLLRNYNAGFCVHDFEDMKVPREVTANFTYVRFHGPTRTKYAGSYSDSQLRRWAEWIAEQRTALEAMYVYFNNDPGAAAVRNALTLKRFIAD
jgi:uncharacterized protein YecE (DUF72 family)